MFGRLARAPKPAVYRRLIIGVALALVIPLAPTGVASSSSSAPGTIDTYAGGAVGSLLVDLFNAPHGIAVLKEATYQNNHLVDTTGTVYIADTLNHRIKKAVPGTDGVFNGSPDEKILNVAGAGIEGFSGDGGPAARSRLDSPHSVAIDVSGTVYVADTGNNRIRKISWGSDLVQNIDTVAGNGSSSELHAPYGLASSDATTTVYIADTFNNQIKRLQGSTLTPVAGTGAYGYSGDGATATAATLRHPRGVAIDLDGNLLIADTSNHRIRKVDVSSGKITPVAGNGQYGYSGDGGDPTEARLNTPWAVAVATQTVNAGVTQTVTMTYIADAGNDRIRRVAASSTITTVDSSLKSPSGLAIDHGRNLLISDTLADISAGAGVIGTGAIRRLIPNTTKPDLIAGGGTLRGCCADDDLPARLARLKRPGGVATFSNGTQTMTYIADTGNHRVIAVDDKLNIRTVAGRECRTNDPDFPGNDGPTQLPRPEAVSTSTSTASTSANVTVNPDPVTGYLALIDPVLPDGPICPVGDGATATAASLNHPWGIALDAAGNLYIADTYNHRIRQVATGPDGVVNAGVSETMTTVAGTGMATRYRLSAPEVKTGSEHDVLDGRRIAVNLGGPTATAATLNLPYGVGVRFNRLYIADTGNDLIRSVDIGTSMISTVAGRGQCISVEACPSGNGWKAKSQWLNGPRGLAIGKDGILYVADTENSAIRKVTPGLNGVVDGDDEERMHTLIGGVLGHCDPDDCFFDPNYPETLMAPVGPTLSGAGRVSRPYGVSVNDEGIVYFADTDAHRARRVDPKNLKYLTIAGSGFEGFSGDEGPAYQAAMRNPGSIIFSGSNAILTDTNNNRVRVITSVENGWSYINQCAQQIPQSDARRLNDPWPVGHKAQGIACRPTDL